MQAPVVDYIRPNSGSLAGGQLVAVHGANLQADWLDAHTPATIVTIGGVPCDVERVLSSAKRVVCRTRPYWSQAGLESASSLDGTGSYYPGWPDPGCRSSRLRVVVQVCWSPGCPQPAGGNILDMSWNSKSRLCRRARPERWCGYSYEWERTPQILSVFPRAVSPGAMVTVIGRTCVGDLLDKAGARLEPALKKFERVLVGGYACELSEPTCDVESTKQCPTMHTANMTRGSYRPQGYTCQEGWFRCRLPLTLPIGWHNLSFHLPSTYGSSMLLAGAVAPVVSLGVAGPGGEEGGGALEVVPLVSSVEVAANSAAGEGAVGYVAGADGGLIVLQGRGLLGATNMSITLGGGLECPQVSSLRTADAVVCNRTAALLAQGTALPSSCLEALQADPAASSGFYMLRPPHGEPLEVYCDMDTAGGGWTLCGKYDRDNALGEATLPAGFGRSLLEPTAMATLNFSSVPSASLDCRTFLSVAGEAARGHLMSVGTNELSMAGWDTSASLVSVTGPLPAGPLVDSLFDPSAPCANATGLRSVGRHFEARTASHLGLLREWWAWDTYGPNLTVGTSYETDGHRPWIAALGCTSAIACPDAILDSSLPPNGTDVMTGPGVWMPSVWRGHRSYTVRLSGWFVPPFTAEYRFVPWSDNQEYVTVYLSTDHDPANARQISMFFDRPAFAQKYKGASWDEGLAYYRLEGGRPYYIRITHAMHKTWDIGRAGLMRLKLCVIPPTTNHSLPDDVGGPNLWWEDASGARTGYDTQRSRPKLNDLTCAPGWASGISGWNWNGTKILEASGGWAGSYAIQPAPPSFFRYNLTDEELQALSQPNRPANTTTAAAADPPPSAWGAVQGARAAITDGAVQGSGCAAVQGAAVFWGVGGGGGGGEGGSTSPPDFGAACAADGEVCQRTPSSSSPSPDPACTITQAAVHHRSGSSPPPSMHLPPLFPIFCCSRRSPIPPVSPFPRTPPAPPALPSPASRPSLPLPSLSRSLALSLSRSLALSLSLSRSCSLALALSLSLPLALALSLSPSRSPSLSPPTRPF